MVTGLLATGLLGADLAIAYAQTTTLPAAPVCFDGATGACFGGPLGALAAFIGFGLFPIVGAIIAGAPGWVMALIQTARWRQWRWFWAILFLSPVATTLYVLLPADKPERLRPQPATSIQASGVWASVGARD